MTKTLDKVLGTTILLAILVALPLGFSVGSTEILSGVPGYIVSLVIVGVVLVVILVRAALGQLLADIKHTGSHSEEVSENSPVAQEPGRMLRRIKISD